MIMNSMKLNKVAKALALASLFGIGAALVAPTHAQAGSANSNLSVTASVNANCTISTTAVAFGPYDPVVTNAATALNGTGTVTIACTKGSAPNVTLDLGANASASQRKMLITGGGADTLNYELYKPSTNTTPSTCSFPGSVVWGTAGAAIFTPTSPNSKASRAFSVCGTVAAGQDVSVGSYQDTVVATVNF
jgi:spore coat protein U-like protein